MRLDAAALAVGVALAAAAAQAGPVLPHRVAVLQGLDKVTARVRQIGAPVGETIELGSLAVTVRACLKTPPTEPPEAAAFLEIDERSNGSERIFEGWMFASSPGLSALEHPVYDVWVLDCAEPLEPAETPAPSASEAPANP